MPLKSSFEISRDDFNGLIIQDTGHADGKMSVTNDAENVVEHLVMTGKLSHGQRLFYYDSEGDLSELVVENGRFVGFKTGGPN